MATSDMSSTFFPTVYSARAQTDLLCTVYVDKPYTFHVGNPSLLPPVSILIVFSLL